MCGITGYISEKISSSELLNSVNVLKHRGPNNQSVWEKKGLGLGHTRLSILDLSEQSNQPMHSHSGRFTMVFNGEIYNYKELAQKYQIQLKTSSDSELVIELFEKLGEEFISELNGMFAIVIFDIQTQNLHIFRDRIGIKPLFYYFDGQGFAFASEIKALLEYQFIKKGLELNQQTINQFLNLGYIAEPHTFFENIYKFPSGHKAVFHNKELSINPFWELEKEIKEQTFDDEKQAKIELERLVKDSVEKRMLSDVPLGTFLSGGVDSSLITAMAQNLSANSVQTFSIGFKESQFNEAKYAQKVAKHLRTNHHEFIVSEKEVLGLVEDFFHAYDEPYTDSSGFPTMLVSQLAKQKVSVILSGDGGDELFHGYGMYNWANRLNQPLIKAFRKPISFALNQMSYRHKRASELFKYQDLSTIKSHIFSQEQFFFSEKEIERLSKIEKGYRLNEIIDSPRKLSPSEEQAIFDLKYYLKDDLLVKVDRASMRSALEVRVPLLDHRIIEFAINLNSNLKIKNGVQKYLLKELLYDYLPKEIFDRPKWGFSIPLNQWLKKDLRALLDQYTDAKLIEKYQILDSNYVQDLKRKYLSGQDYLYNRLWSIMILHKNLEKYFS